MRLRAGIVDDPESVKADTIKLEYETDARGGFAELGDRAGFDAAIIVNHDYADRTGLTVAAGQRVKYFQPANIGIWMKSINDALSELNKLTEKPKKLDDRVLVAFFSRLADAGRLAHDDIISKCGELLSKARRVQVTEARSGAYLPIEYLYERYAPKDKAPMCAHAMEAMKGKLLKSKCPRITDDSEVCPLSFWGLQRVIEHRPLVGPADAAEFEFCEPKLGADRLRPFELASFSASKRVANKDQRSLTAALKRKTLQAVLRPQNWDTWKNTLAEKSPSLMVLLPHTATVSNQLTMEIGGSTLKISSIEKEYVSPSRRTPGPVVLLLGCSTTIAEGDLQSCVGRIKMKGASIVVGTLSTIRGRHATTFVNEFLSALEEARKQDTTFGDALLEVKQRMLAKGDPFALTLTAYGDADWRI